VPLISSGRGTALVGVGQPGQNGRWARPTVLGLGPKAQPSTVRGFFYFSISFLNYRNSYKILKFVQNEIKLRKIRNKFL
jgi:hypothetical protein